MHVSRLLVAAMLLTTSLAPAQIPPELRNDGLLLRTSAGFSPATQLTTEIAIHVTGIVARVSIRQRFRNPSDDWVEGIYVFPLPDDAAVDSLVMQLGDRRIEGEIQERNQAKQTYERARAAGQQASLVEQARPNLFTTSVANIAPGQEVVVEIGYLQTAGFDDGSFELRLPLTLTPRFNPGGVAAGERIAPPVRTAAPAPSHRAAIAIAIAAGVPVAEAGSPSHALVSAWDGTMHRLTTGDEQVAMDRDLVVNWSVVADQQPRVAAFAETVAGQSFLQLMFVPPASAELMETSPRELLFVIDTSGSMGGNSIARARTALQSALDRLTPADRFNLIEFNSQARSLFAAPVAAAPGTVADARRFVSRLRADGGTNMAAALAAALGQRTTQGVLRQIVFITDGSVGNEAELFGQIRRSLGTARMFTVGIGNAPNTHFMRKAAQFGRGSYLQITRAEDVETSMRRLFTKLEHVALTDIEIEWPEGFEVYPEPIPDLYRGEPVVVAARTGGSPRQPLSIAVAGRIGSYDWADSVRVSAGNAPGIASVWARRKIESLTDRRLEGETEDAIREAVLDVALAYGIVSAYTSLVAVDRTPERTRNALLRREALASLLPAGASLGAELAFLPATATGSRWQRLVGALAAISLLGLAGMLHLAARRES